MEEDGESEHEPGPLLKEHPDVKWRSRGTADGNQSGPQNDHTRGGGSKNMPKSSPRKRVPKRMEEGVIGDDTHT